MKRSLFAVSVLVIVSSIVGVLAQTPAAAKDPRIGTWKLNVEKSQGGPATPPRMIVRRWEARPDGFTIFTQATIDAQGNPHFIHNAYKVDGKDYPSYDEANLLPSLAGAKTLRTTSVKVVDAYTATVSIKDDKGVAGIPYTDTVSRDGKTLTRVTKGRNSQGQDINSVLVHDRQ
jgi:hypothetical protein